MKTKTGLFVLKLIFFVFSVRQARTLFGPEVIGGLDISQCICPTIHVFKDPNY